MSASNLNPEPESERRAKSPFLRAQGDLNPATSGNRLPGVAARPQLRAVPGGKGSAKDLQSAAPELSPPRVRPRFLGLSFPWWLAIAASLGFYSAVQYALHLRVEAPPTVVSEVGLIPTQGPSTPLPAGQLWLKWQSVDGAERYDLRIHDLHGSPVVDPMPAYGTTWNPPDDLLPGLIDGSYRWTIEAVDGAGQVLARSLPAEFKIGR